MRVFVLIESNVYHFVFQEVAVEEEVADSMIRALRNRLENFSVFVNSIQLSLKIECFSCKGFL